VTNATNYNRKISYSFERANTQVPPQYREGSTLESVNACQCRAYDTGDDTNLQLKTAHNDATRTSDHCHDERSEIPSMHSQIVVVVLFVQQLQILVPRNEDYYLRIPFRFSTNAVKQFLIRSTITKLNTAKPSVKTCDAHVYFVANEIVNNHGAACERRQ
jgi:hypothetical protein